jgi:hypothetical protein
VLATQAYKHKHHKLANRLVDTAEATYGTAVDLAPFQGMKLLMRGVTS